MNREEKRKAMKKIAGFKEYMEYEKAVNEVAKKAAQDAVDNLEKAFAKKWVEDDSTMNNGELWNERNNDEDDIYNV